MINHSKIFILYLIIINIFTFILVYIDKQKAVKHKWRISEKNYFIISILGGCLGMLLGMKLFHHKTKHPTFYIGIPLILITWIIILYKLKTN